MTPTRLPEKLVQLVLVSGEYPDLADSLRVRGIHVLTTERDRRLPTPVQWHPDMQVCIIDGEAVVLKGSALTVVLSGYGITVEETYAIPNAGYPHDVLCNVLSWGAWVLGNPKTVDKRIHQKSKDSALNWISVKQGYAACSTVLVDQKSAITADEGVASALERHGIEILQIHPGFIELPGYEYGFLGGCCGKLSSQQMAFTGQLDFHPDGNAIVKFLAAREIEVVELMECPLLDVGGMIALC